MSLYAKSTAHQILVGQFNHCFINAKLNKEAIRTFSKMFARNIVKLQRLHLCQRKIPRKSFKELLVTTQKQIIKDVIIIAKYFITLAKNI